MEIKNTTKAKCKVPQPKVYKESAVVDLFYVMATELHLLEMKLEVVWSLCLVSPGVQEMKYLCTGIHREKNSSRDLSLKPTGTFLELNVETVMTAGYPMSTFTRK